MRKLWCVAVLTSAAAVLPATSAGAASQTVAGTGDIEKLVVDWGTKAGYEIDNGCYSGGTWAASLVYLADRAAPEGGTIVECPKLRFTWDAAAKAHRAKVPRSCIPKAGNKLRVRAEGVNFTSVTGGEAGPTKRLRRG